MVSCCDHLVSQLADHVFGKVSDQDLIFENKNPARHAVT